MEYKLQPFRVLVGFLAVVSVLLAMNILGIIATQYLTTDEIYRKLIALFDFRHEKNFPTLYSCVAIMFCSLLLAYIAFLIRSKNPIESYYWLVLSAVFAFLALDEILEFHEKLIVPVRKMLGTSGLLYWPWMIPYGIVFTLLGIVYLPWLSKLPRRTLPLFIGAGLIYLLGAIGFEMLGAQEAELYGYSGLKFSILYTFEELFEMLGIVLFIYALLSYINGFTPSITFRTLADRTLAEESAPL